MNKLLAWSRRFKPRARVNSESLVRWVWWMVIDILDSGKWSIEYSYVYFDRYQRMIVVRKRPILLTTDKRRRYQRLDACVDPEKYTIFIDPEADDDRALCLFHECLEILFADWKDEYFVPERWGIEDGVDPISYLEAATWDKLGRTQKNAIKKYLPKPR